MKSDRDLVSFRNPAAMRAWLATHHATARELLLRCFKVHAAERGVGYAQALDEALCYGWIDGIRRAVDADSFSVRFTPRKPDSIWSRVNIGHVERLIAAGRMKPSGLDAYARRDNARTARYSFERELPLSPAVVKRFRAHKAAWKYYEARPPGYRRLTAHWVMSAAKDETREKRLATLIECSARQSPIPALDRRPKQKPDQEEPN
jgi:uncharacterized protein YdeI (YjbR/CyaY-like superfamily)